MKEDDDQLRVAFGKGFVAGMVIFGFIGWCLGIWTEDIFWHEWTIEHEAGHYDGITGEFKWNNEVTKEPRQ